MIEALIVAWILAGALGAWGLYAMPTVFAEHVDIQEASKILFAFRRSPSAWVAVIGCGPVALACVMPPYVRKIFGKEVVQ